MPDVFKLESLINNNKFFYHLYVPQKKQSKGLCFFVHGLGDTYKSFDRIINYLIKEDYSVLYYDLPGCGENKTIEIEFEENIDLINQIVELNKKLFASTKIYFFAHSMGGLILLLTLARYNMPDFFIKTLVVEPSLALPDLQFFKWIKEPPNGIGYEGLLAMIKNEPIGQYASTYRNNLMNTNLQVFQQYVKKINEKFLSYQSEILGSNINFVYIYGKDSTGVEEREKLFTSSNIKVCGFENSAHWVHIDAEKRFIDFIKDNVLI
ncbi:conserved hypothetical protein [Beggiatoa sp. PS]|nr:conserved hypothetical protein [Beggiatoa sp. PS]